MPMSATRTPNQRRRRPKRELLAEALALSRLRSLLLRMPCWQGVLVLTYHRIGHRAASPLYKGVFSATAEELDAQLKLIRRHFDVIDPREFGSELLTRRGRRVMVSFDDGYRDLYEAAGPVLEANGVSAAMFVCSGFVDGEASAWWDEIAWMLGRSKRTELPPGPWSTVPLRLDGDQRNRAIELVLRVYWQTEYAAGEAFLERLADATQTARRPPSPEDWITWEMVSSLKNAGHVIGAHTVTHPILATASPARQRQEIVGSVDRIRAALGERPTLFAYPVGIPASFDRTTQALAHEAGIEYAFSNYLGHVSRAGFDPLDVRRIPAEMAHTAELLSATLALPQVFARAEVPRRAQAAVRSQSCGNPC